MSERRMTHEYGQAIASDATNTTKRFLLPLVTLSQWITIRVVLWIVSPAQYPAPVITDADKALMSALSEVFADSMDQLQALRLNIHGNYRYWSTVKHPHHRYSLHNTAPKVPVAPAVRTTTSQTSLSVLNVWEPHRSATARGISSKPHATLMHRQLAILLPFFACFLIFVIADSLLTLAF
ncbi:hypothetical protein V1505DRAFT_389198 [Lipomyces doorenjongii]